MPGLFENTVSALCDEIARSQNSGFEPMESLSTDDITDFVLGQWRRMPRFLAWPLRFATIAFAVSGLWRGGALFHRLTPSRRGLLLEAWRQSRIGPCRDLVRFYRSLAIFAFYSRLDGTSE